MFHVFIGLGNTHVSRIMSFSNTQSCMLSIVCNHWPLPYKNIWEYTEKYNVIYSITLHMANYCLYFSIHCNIDIKYLEMKRFLELVSFYSLNISIR